MLNFVNLFVYFLDDIMKLAYFEEPKCMIKTYLIDAFAVEERDHHKQYNNHTHYYNTFHKHIVFPVKLKLLTRSISIVSSGSLWLHFGLYV